MCFLFSSMLFFIVVYCCLSLLLFPFPLSRRLKWSSSNLLCLALPCLASLVSMVCAHVWLWYGAVAGPGPGMLPAETAWECAASPLWMRGRLGDVSGAKDKKAEVGMFKLSVLMDWYYDDDIMSYCGALLVTIVDSLTHSENVQCVAYSDTFLQSCSQITWKYQTKTHTVDKSQKRRLRAGATFIGWPSSNVWAHVTVPNYSTK